jgi:four helix bundle protein
MYSLTEEVRQPSRSVSGQIAEVWAKRKYRKHLISKLTDADGEQLETQHWIETAVDCGSVPAAVGHGLLLQYESVDKMLNSTITKASSSCDASTPT